MGLSGRTSGSIVSECVMDIASDSGFQPPCSTTTTLASVATYAPPHSAGEAHDSMEISSNTVGSVVSHTMSSSSDIVELTPVGRPLPVPEELLVQAIPGNPSTLRLTWFYDEEVLEQLANPDHPLRRLTFEVRQQSEAAKGHRRTRMHICPCRGLNAAGDAPEHDVGEQEFEVRGCTPGRNYFFSVRAVGEFQVAGEPDLKQVRSGFSEVVPWLTAADIHEEPAGMTSVASLDLKACESPIKGATPAFQFATCLAEAAPQSEPSSPQKVAMLPAHAARAIQPSVEIFQEDGTPHGIVKQNTADMLAQQAAPETPATQAAPDVPAEAMSSFVDASGSTAEAACSLAEATAGDDQAEPDAPATPVAKAERSNLSTSPLGSPLLEPRMIDASPAPDEAFENAQTKLTDIFREAKEATRTRMMEAVQNQMQEIRRRAEEACRQHGSPEKNGSAHRQELEISSESNGKPENLRAPKSAFAQAFTSYCVDHGQPAEGPADETPADEAVSAGRGHDRTEAAPDFMAVDEPVPSATVDAVRADIVSAATFSAGNEPAIGADSALPLSVDTPALPYAMHMHEASLLTTEFECSADERMGLPIVVTVEPETLNTADVVTTVIDGAPGSQVLPEDGITCTASQAISSPTSAETTASSASPPPCSPKSQQAATLTASASEGPLLSSTSQPTAELEQVQANNCEAEEPGAASDMADAAAAELPAEPPEEQKLEQAPSLPKTAGAQATGTHMDKWMSKILARGPVRRGEPPCPQASEDCSPIGSKASRTFSRELTVTDESEVAAARQYREQAANELPPRELTMKDESEAGTGAACAAPAACTAPAAADLSLSKSNTNVPVAQVMQVPKTITDARRFVSAGAAFQGPPKADQPVVVLPKPLVVQAVETRAPIHQPVVQQAAPQPAAPLTSFTKGEVVHIWSNSQNTWMVDGMVEEVLAVPRMSEGPSPPAGVLMPAGALKVTSSAGLKWIMPEMISSQIRKPTKSVFKKGDTVHVWSNSVNTWMTDGIVLEVNEVPFCSEGGSVPAGTMVPIGAVRVASSAGMKWIMPDLCGIHLRKASDEAINPLTIVDGVKPQLAQEVQKQVSNEQPVVMPSAQAKSESVQRLTTLPIVDDVGPTVLSLPKRIIRADSSAAEPQAVVRTLGNVAAAAPSPQKAMAVPKTVAHSSANQNSSALLAGPTVLALPKMVMQPESLGSSLESSGLNINAALGAAGPTVMALPKAVVPAITPRQGAEQASMCNPLAANGPTVIAVPKMVGALSNPEPGPGGILGASNPTVMALPTPADVLRGGMQQQFPAAHRRPSADHSMRTRGPQMPTAPSVAPPSSNQPGPEWFTVERRPEMSQRLNRANELQQRLMSQRQGQSMGYPNQNQPMMSVPEQPQFAVPQVPQFEFSCNPPPAAAPGYEFDLSTSMQRDPSRAPGHEFDLSMSMQRDQMMMEPVGGYGGGSVGGSSPYTLRVLTSNNRWEELPFSATDNLEDLGSNFLRRHCLKDAFLFGLVDSMRDLVASGQAERSVDVIDLL